MSELVFHFYQGGSLQFNLFKKMRGDK